MPGTTTLGAEITNVSGHCVWILIDDEELALPYSEFPWFKTQNDWSITWVDVVLTVLPLVCELYVVVSIHYWVSFTHITKFLIQ